MLKHRSERIAKFLKKMGVEMREWLNDDMGLEESIKHLNPRLTQDDAMSLAVHAAIHRSRQYVLCCYSLKITSAGLVWRFAPNVKGRSIVVLVHDEAGRAEVVPVGHK